VTEKTVNVPNIACDHCVATIEQALSGLDGVETFDVSREEKRVKVAWQEPGTDWETIRARLEEAGYPPAAS